MRRAALAGAALLLLGAAEKTVTPGSYCPLPEGDEPPACLQPATRDYARFFSGLEQGSLDEAATGQVEGDLAGERRYEALSSLIYAYYVLSRRAAASEQVDPAIAERLEGWNALLGRTYRASGDRRFRGAMRQAGGDLRERAPSILVRCTDEAGNTVACESTAAAVAAMSDARDRTGVRGAVGRLLERLMGGGP